LCNMTIALHHCTGGETNKKQNVNLTGKTKTSFSILALCYTVKNEVLLLAVWKTVML